MGLPLMEVLATLPDPRQRRCRRHPLPAILALAGAAVRAGTKSLEAMAPFGRDHGTGGTQQSGRHSPAHGTSRGSPAAAPSLT